MIGRYKRVFPAAIVLSGFILAASPAFAKGNTVPQDEYRALVQECRAFLNAREIDPATAKKLALRLRAIGSVVRPSGQTFPVDTKPESDALDAILGTTPDKKLQQRFAVLEEQLSTGVPTPAKKDSHATAEQILAAGEFKTSRPEKLEGKGWDWSFLPRWLKPVGTALEPTLRWIGNGFKKLGKWFAKGIDGFFRGIGKFFRWLANRFPQPKGKWNAKNPFASLGNNVLLTLIFLATVAAIVGVYFFTRYLFDLYEIRTGRRKRASGALGGDLDLSDEGITDPLNTARERAAQTDLHRRLMETWRERNPDTGKESYKLGVSTGASSNLAIASR